MSEYDTYNQFCIDNINKAEDAQLLYDHVGTSQLQFVPAGFWLHPSRTSACIAFQTNLPAKGRVECATGQVPPEDEREFNLHIYHITGLALDSEHSYTIHAKRGAQEIEQSGSFSTATPPGAVLVTPADGNAITLNQNNTSYVLTTDWDADIRAFTIHANNVVFDLDGHLVTYDNLPRTDEPEPHGIYCEYNLQSVTIRNGRILQGPQQTKALTTGRGANPIRSHTSPIIAEGMNLHWGGENVPGIYCGGGASGHTIRHNVLLDEGTGIENRHQAVRAMDLQGSDDVANEIRVDNCLVKRCRHRGIDTRDKEATVRNCEVWQDSWAANAFGIYAPRVSECFGYVAGYWAAAHAWQRVRPMVLENNYVNGYGIPNDRDTEYGTISTLAGFRMVYYLGNEENLDDNQIRNNTVVLRGREGANMRGISWTQDLRAKNNLISGNVLKSYAEDETMPVGNTISCITLHGSDDPRHVPHAISSWLNNTCISNVCMVVTGENYGSGSHTQWHNNRFERLGDHSQFATIRNVYSARQSVEHNFHNTTAINCTLENADYGFHTEGHERWYNVYPDGYQMRSTSEGMVKIPLTITETYLITEADEYILLEDGTQKLYLESASPIVIQPVRPYVYSPRRVIGTRPHDFRIDHTHHLADGLVFAAMGRIAGTQTYHESSRYGARADINVTNNEHIRAMDRPALLFSGPSGISFPAHSRYNTKVTYTWAFWMQRPTSAEHGVISQELPRRYWLYMTNAGRLFVYLSGSGGNRSFRNSTGVNLGPGWHHIVATYPGGSTSNGRIYFNGNNVSTSNDGDPGTLNAGTNLTLGEHGTLLGRNLQLADVMQWDRVLTASEVADLYRAAQTPMYYGFLQPKLPQRYAIPRGEVMPTPPEVRTNIFESLTIGW